MVPDLQSLGQRADCGRPAALEAFHLQEHDVLLRLDARGTCSFLADAEKAPDVIAQIGERLVVHSRRGPAARGPRTHPRRTVSPRDNSPCDISAGTALVGPGRLALGLPGGEALRVQVVSIEPRGRAVAVEF